MSKNMLTRILVAAIAIPAILWIVYQGEKWLLGMVFSFGAIALGEFFCNEKIKPSNILFWLSAAAFVLIFFSVAGLLIDTAIGWNTSWVVIEVIGFFLISGMFVSMGKEEPAKLFARHSRLVWGVLYISLLYPIVYLLGNGVGNFHGGDSLLLLFGILWVGDTAAMQIGRKFGKTKLAPTVSPNKTVEGFFGGLVGAAVIAAVMYFWKFSFMNLSDMFVVAMGCSIFGQLGDLVESMWKRSLGIKDSSKIIPGHGGVLDRFDSLLFAAPFMYAYLNIISV
jgi:phosphatidate cytidylyltransferase